MQSRVEGLPTGGLFPVVWLFVQAGNFIFKLIIMCPRFITKFVVYIIFYYGPVCVPILGDF
jgi:hypothetical protein